MTENPEHFLPGDVVERIGEDITFSGIANGSRYVVSAYDPSGYVELEGIYGEFRAKAFKLIERPER